MKTILYINHKKKKCGVYQFGKSIGLAISKSNKFNFIYCECESLKELSDAVNKYTPKCVIFNYHPSTQQWADNNIRKYVKVPTIGTMHVVDQQIADDADNSIFDYWIAPDPTLLLRNPIVYKTGRLIMPGPIALGKVKPESTKIIIGSFGFGINGKGFERIIEIVEYEFDGATIRLNIPFAEFGDKDGTKAKAISDSCRKLLKKNNTKLVITHEFWDHKDLMSFLNSNTINVFFYDGNGRGISSVIDFALGVDRPIAISCNSMFRHVLSTKPSICIADLSLTKIILNGVQPLQKFKNEWTFENLVWDYERIVNSILNKPIPKRNIPIITKLKSLIGKDGKNDFSWLRANETIHNEEAKFLSGNSFTGVSGPKSFNRILNNSARELYAPVVEQMINLMPKTMAKKIPSANVQQAFTLDTIYEFVKKVEAPKILCVGSYESTDAMFLKRLGFDIEEIDPVLNYSLEEFFTKPTTIKGSYDIVFSTSVIEHVENDDLFIKQIGELLTKDGIGVITCDYKEGYKIGDPKPNVNFRFYTQEDLGNRFMKSLPDCRLLDDPVWNCLNPDFNYGGFNYTFATFCFKKMN